MNTATDPSPLDSGAPAPKLPPPETVFGRPRDFLGNRFVYVVLSSRAGGLSIGVNMNPDQHCSFDCVYCEVDRERRDPAAVLDVDVMAEELHRTVAMVNSGTIREMPGYGNLPANLLKLRHVSLSGDGEPTLCPKFQEVLESVLHVRAITRVNFKIVLVTNGSGLDLPVVQRCLNRFTSQDEIWAKLDAGSEAYMKQVNRTDVPLSRIMANILMLGRERPVIIQSLFPLLDGQEPCPAEITNYINRLQELKAGGAMISLVQIYSASRPMAHIDCGHIPLKSLFRIAKTIQTETGLRAEVF